MTVKFFTETYFVNLQVKCITSDYPLQNKNMGFQGKHPVLRKIFSYDTVLEQVGQ